MSPTGYLTIVLLILGAIVLLTIGFSWLLARLFCRPTRRRPTATPADHGLPFEAVTFTSHGVPLKGWFILTNGNPTPQPTIIVAHGWSTNASKMLPLAQLLHAAGFGVFLYDARGHGASGADGPITGPKFAEDLLAAVGYLVQRAEVDLTRLGVVGHSLGASGAILAASTEPRIRALVSSSAFADPVDVVSDFLRAFHLPQWPFLGLVSYFINRWLETNMTDEAPQNRIGQIQAPLLLIHGDSDQYIPSSNLEALYARTQPGNAQRWLVPGRRHLNVIRDPDYGPRVISFLKEHLDVKSFESVVGVRQHDFGPRQVSGKAG